MYTDGLIEGRISQGPYRLDTEGLMDLVRDALGPLPHNPLRLSDGEVLQRLMEQVRKLNSGDLNDDIAMLALGYSRPGRANPGATGRSAGSSAPPCC